MASGSRGSNAAQHAELETQMGTLQIRVQPRASRNEIKGFSTEGVLSIRVTAPPRDGKANEVLIKLLAKELGVAPSGLQIVRGATSRNKVIDVVELSEKEIRQRLVADSRA